MHKTMDQLVQCPVCTLFLHNGMSLETHLDTHPKDQVIKALCTLSAINGLSSRTGTPLHSERSYRSRSRTPACEDNRSRWNGSQRGSEHDRYWRRTPSRTPKSTSMSRICTPTPEVRMLDMNFDNNTVNNCTQCPGTPYSMKSDKMQQTYTQNVPMTDFDLQYSYGLDQHEDKEIKYSRSADYTPMDSSSTVYSHNMPTVGTGMKLHTAMIPTLPCRGNDLVKVLPKPNNILVKTNVGGVQYIAPGMKQMHVMVPTTSAYVQKNIQNNMIVTGNLPTTQILENKTAPSTMSSNQFHPSSGAFTPSTTVVTQNSQIIYREMVHNLDGKPFISTVPAVLGNHDNMTNVAQTSSMYQNVMVLDQFGNTSCMYTAPQHVLPKPCTSVFNETLPTSGVDKTVPNIMNDSNKTLIIEVSPMVSQTTSIMTESLSSTREHSSQVETHVPKDNLPPTNKKESKRQELPRTSKGLKILSNIKVEVPVQHHKNMVNTVLDLTGSTENDYPERPISPEKILPDFDGNNHSMSNDCTQPSTSSGDSLVSHTFSVIKNVGNPPSYKESTTKTSIVDNKIETEFSDSCPVPDLICNEKPSISPCSELSENCENSTDRTSFSPKPQSSQSCHSSIDNIAPKPNHCVQKTYPLRLNNIYVKKHKKVLQIKNAKPTPNETVTKTESEPIPSSSSSKTLENFTINKVHQPDGTENVSYDGVDEIKKNESNEFDADTEEQSMDIEPVAPSSINQSKPFSNTIDLVQVKIEINNSNEDCFSNGAGASNRDHLTTLESIRPINVITYGNMSAGDFDDESNHRELLDLEAASKNKHFVNMMNENYYAENMYADYFTPDRVESFDAEREAGLWGEPSQKESEFVLPNFIHESYKIVDSSGVDCTDIGDAEGRGDVEGDGCERDSKADVLSESRSEGEPTLNICADERMPPRGELSGQESNGDMESSWSGMYQEVALSEPYDLMARESWQSDGSDVDETEKTKKINILPEVKPMRAARQYTCPQCGVKLPSLKEMRAHRALAHATPGGSGGCGGSGGNTYSRLVTVRTIKKEEKSTEVTSMLQNNHLLAVDSKESITTSMMQVYNVIGDIKPPIEGLIKLEPKRRRRDFVCPTCKVDQQTDAGFHAHLKTHPLECLTCGKCFFRRANLALHLKMHFGIKNYKCEVCEKRFITRQKLSEHHNVHTGRAPVKCTVCDETFRRFSNMVQHRNRHHLHKKAKVRDFVCHCGGVFHSRAKLRWHMETHEERPKACLYCSDKFVHSASLTRHVRRTHNEYYLSERLRGKDENAACPVCKQVYLRSNLRTHMLTHSGKRPYQCVVCNKAFTTKWNLKLHRWTHMSRSSKPYKCALCKGAFIRHTEYVSHMNAHKSVRPYTCNHCGCQFIRKYNCQRHVREHETAKKYVCKVPECGKSFHRSYYLSEHMKVHSGVRPFSCNLCGKTSSNKSNHNKHVKIHHAREPVATEA